MSRGARQQQQRRSVPILFRGEGEEGASWGERGGEGCWAWVWVGSGCLSPRFLGLPVGGLVGRLALRRVRIKCRLSGCSESTVPCVSRFEGSLNESCFDCLAKPRGWTPAGVCRGSGGPGGGRLRAASAPAWRRAPHGVTPPQHCAGPFHSASSGVSRAVRLSGRPPGFDTRC